MTQNNDFSSDVEVRWIEVEEHLSKLSAEMFEVSLSSRLDVMLNTKWLNMATALYPFLVQEHRKWDSLKTNNEVGYYVELKRTTTDKFVSAAAEREASFMVAKERYMRNRAEANLLACENIINTCKVNSRILIGEKTATP